MGQLKLFGKPTYTINDYIESLKKCMDCPIYQEGRIFVPPYIPKNDPPGIVIGEAPGPTEAAQGKPFVGASGQLLRKIFNELGDDLDNYYVTNVFKCYPGRIPKITQRAVAIAQPKLEEELAFWKSLPVLVLGAVASRAYTAYSISMAGKVLDVKGRKVVIGIHPAYVLRGHSTSFVQLGKTTTRMEALRDSIKVFIDIARKRQ